MINLTDPQWLIALSGILGGFIGLIIWSVRLEGKVKLLEKDTDRLDAALSLLETKSDQMNDKIFEKLSHIEITLANLLGKLDTNAGIKK